MIPEEKNIKITLKKAKEWYNQGGELKQVALQAYSEEELNDNKPHSWEEFCKNNPIKSEFFITDSSNIIGVAPTGIERTARTDKNLCNSKEEAEAFLALMQLRQLHKIWVGDWEPQKFHYFYQIVNHVVNGVTIYCVYDTSSPLSFPTKEMAEEFLNDFQNLIEIAKPLI